MIEPSAGESKRTKYVLPPTLLHDLRSPLNHVIGYAELLLELADETGSEAFAPDLTKVLAAGHRLLSIIGENFASEIQPTFTLPSAPLNLAEESSSQPVPTK